MGLKVRLKLEGAKESQALIEEALDRYQQSFRSLFQQLADQWTHEVLPGNILAGGRPEPFEPLSLAAQRLRTFFYGAGRATGPILIRRGDLLNSLQILSLTDDEVVIGSRHFLAGLHERGYVTAAASRIPGKEVPARPWIHLAAEAVQDAFEQVDGFLIGGTEFVRG